MLEDPSHSASEQPGFDVQLLNAAGSTIDPTCGVYNVYAGQPGQNFQDCNGVKWLPWNTVGLNLTPYIGTQISIEFTTKDCSLGGYFGIEALKNIHVGYAYDTSINTFIKHNSGSHTFFIKYKIMNPNSGKKCSCNIY